MNFKSFPFLVHLHNLYIVKVFVRFRLFYGIATLQIILLLCIPGGGGGDTPTPYEMGGDARRLA